MYCWLSWQQSGPDVGVGNVIGNSQRSHHCRGSRQNRTEQNRTEQNRTLYFDREVSVHIYKYIHIQHSYASSNRTLCIN